MRPRSTMLLGIVAAGVIAINAGVQQLLVAELLLIVAIGVATVAAVRASISGRAPGGTRWALPLALGLGMWALGHVAEAAQASAHRGVVAFGFSDVLFVSSVAVLAPNALPVLRQTARYTDKTLVLRTSTDALLLTLAATLLYWVFVVAPSGAGPLATTMAIGYTASCSVFGSAAVIRAWQRGDRASWLLAASASLAVAGVIAWSSAKVGHDWRLLGVTLMTLGMIGFPIGVTHPSNAQTPVVRRGDERDWMGALAAHLLAWALVWSSLEPAAINRGLIVLGLASILTIMARLFAVRHSELALVDQLRRMAFTDPLTGVANRRALIEALQTSAPGWILFLDLDGFKQVNDTFGHEAGDQLLTSVARRLQQVCGDRALVSRMGGDEFAVLLPDLAPSSATRIAHTAVARAYHDRYQSISASAGLAHHGPNDEPNETLRNADLALQAAKRDGKNRAVVLGEVMLAEHLRQRQVIERLGQGMSGLTVRYQPIMHLRAGTPGVAAVEALARWSDPELGSMPTQQLIEVCERNGLISQVGDHMLGQVLRQLQTWRSAGINRQVSLNVSPAQLRDDVAVAAMATQLARAGDLARYVILEVTETALADDSKTLPAIAHLRQLGCLVAVDDFGSGASSLTRLRTLPVDILKLDKGLVQGITTDPTGQAVLEMVFTLGRTVGMAVVAEGVEDDATAQLLIGMGCEFAQGYHYSRPVSVVELGHPGPVRFSRRGAHAPNRVLPAG